jgi:hypothetical protein
VNNLDLSLWQSFSPDRPPQCSGIYGFYLGRSHQWLYIGKSSDIAKRFKSPYHPYHLARSLSQHVGYFYIPREGKLSKLEHQLHSELNPLGNGGTTSGRHGYVNGDEIGALAGWNPQNLCYSPAISSEVMKELCLLGHSTGSMTSRYIG